MPLNQSQVAQIVVLVLSDNLLKGFKLRSQLCIESFKGMRRRERTLDELDKVVKGKRRDEKFIFCLYKLEESVLSLINTSETFFR
jgi:hypothetical protein